MSADIILESGLEEAFHLMYDNFPGAVMLTHKSKTIVAVNRAAEMLGRGVGTVCSTIGTREMHQGCLANRALAEQRPMSKVVDTENSGDVVRQLFWVPIKGTLTFTCILP